MTKPSLVRNVNDIDLSGVADQQTLKWDSASGKVKPGYKPATSGADQHLPLTDTSGGLTVSQHLYVAGSVFSSTAIFSILTLAAGSIANNTTTGLFGVWSAVEGNLVSSGGNGFQVNYPGVYLITASLYWAANASGSRELGLWKAYNAWSGGTKLAFDTRGAAPNGYVSHSISTLVKLTALDCIYATAWQNCGGTLGFDTANNPNYLKIARIA